MLRARHCLIPPVVRHSPLFYSNPSVQWFRMDTNNLTSSVAKERSSGKRGPRKKKIVTTTTSQEMENSFREFRTKVIALKKKQLKLLAGNLERSPAVVVNPAQILDISRHNNNLQIKPLQNLSVQELMAVNTLEQGRNREETSVTDNMKVKVDDYQTPSETVVFSSQEITAVNTLERSINTLKDTVTDDDKVKIVDDQPRSENVTSSENVKKSLTKSKRKKSKNSVKLESNVNRLDQTKTSQRKSTKEETNNSPTTPRTHVHQILVNMGFVDEAYKLKWSFQSSDILLRGFARRFDYATVQELWKNLVRRGGEPTIDSYISVMIALSKADPSNEKCRAVFHQVFKEFKAKGHTPELAFLRGNFNDDDRLLFARSLELFSDEPRQRSEDAAYTNPLVKDLTIAGSARLRSQVGDLLTREQLQPLVREQLETELNGKIRVASIFKGKGPSKKKQEFLQNLQKDWERQIAAAIKKRIRKKKEAKGRQAVLHRNLAVFLERIPLSRLVSIVSEEATQLCLHAAGYSVSAGQMEAMLGGNAFDAYNYSNYQHHMDRLRQSYDKYLDWYVSPGHWNTHRAAWQHVAGDWQPDCHDWPDLWLTWVGRELREVLLEDLNLVKDANGDVVVGNRVLAKDGGGGGGQAATAAPKQPTLQVPAFYKIYRSRATMQTQETKPHPSVSALYQGTVADHLLNADVLPMVCPPVPWTGPRYGGFLLRNTGLVKTPYGQTKSEVLNRLVQHEPGQLDPVLDAVNQAGALPWKVNQGVLDLAKTVFTSPQHHHLFKALSLPLHPDYLPEVVPDPKAKELLEKGAKSSEEKRILQKYYKEQISHKKAKDETYALWCDTNYRLSIANQYKDKLLWFPNQLDFRGRMYPVQAYFNHTGGDLARSLCVFARGKPLGPSGLRWLKLHCINLTGLKKRDSVEERLKYADQILDKILDSANNPLTGEQWFLASDEPWQTYGVCLEIRNALAHPSGPENFVSHLPIHQDGSCNGLQHYAALGRDRLGAAAVNLLPADRPQDIYSEIAAIVERKRKADADNGHQLAQALEGAVSRKVVKQTVMTTVYGVTQYGANLQIRKQLKNLEKFSEDEVFDGGKYLARYTFESLNELFTASQQLQEWLTDCAKIISHDARSNVRWETPLGFPVEQPYSKQKIDGDVKMLHMKQRNGFPPNFIHSLDSCHMMLTALHLMHRGIDFASVHDCFWSHAIDVAEMNVVCRDQFVNLHSSPILPNLSSYFQNNFVEVPPTEEELKRELKLMEKQPGTILPRALAQEKRRMLFMSVPEQGELDLNLVKDSVYFFS